MLLTLEPIPKYTEHVRSVVLRLLRASSIVLENCKTSRKAYVHGLPKRVIVSGAPPLNLYDTPILAEEYPVRLPKKPAHAIFAKGTDPCSVG